MNASVGIAANPKGHTIVRLQNGATLDITPNGQATGYLPGGERVAVATAVAYVAPTYTLPSLLGAPGAGAGNVHA